MQASNQPRGPALRDRSAPFGSQQHLHRIEVQVQWVQAVDFFNVLTGPQLLEKAEALLAEHRERRYLRMVTLAVLLKQALEEDRSCQKAVNGWIGATRGRRVESSECPQWRV